MGTTGVGGSVVTTSTAVLRVGGPVRRRWVRNVRLFCRRQPVGAVMAAALLLIVLIAIAAPIVAPYDPIAPGVGDPLMPPDVWYWMGTDSLGRDILSRIIFGARISLSVGAISVGIGTIAGIAIGVVSGYAGGKVDMVVQRMLDTVMSLPGLVLALALAAVLGPSTTNVMIAIAVVLTPYSARLIRGSTLSVREMEYITAARVIGAMPWQILLRHIIPNVIAPAIVLASMMLGNAILIEASLSFLGMGTTPPTPSWGLMLSGEGRYYTEQAPWIAIFPGLAISVTVLILIMLGDTVRDVLDPKLRGE